MNHPEHKMPMFPKYRRKQVLIRDEDGLADDEFAVYSNDDCVRDKKELLVPEAAAPQTAGVRG